MKRQIFMHAFPLLTAVLFVFMQGCADSKRPDAEGTARDARPPASAPAATPAPTQAPPPPELSEASPADLRECVKRVYGHAVTVEEGRPDNYATGDFNGDGSRDIAVFVRPGRGMLREINDELANWILEDPREVQPPRAEKVSAASGERPPRVRVARGDLLLAVIHGHKGEGWRNPAATQTYLLRNAAGSGLKTSTRAEARDMLRAEGQPPSLTGDVMSESLAREQGFLYWNGAKYAWHHLGVL
jgi:hypothetical protein